MQSKVRPRSNFSSDLGRNTLSDLTMCSSSHASSPTTFYGFLHRMRHPAAIDIVRSIKSFIVSFSFHGSDAESDSQRLQDFLLTMENTIRDHPLWSGATEEEIDNAVEGLEKYVMTKLFNRTFACSLEDAKFDQEISEKIYLLQHFIKPEHLDVSEIFHNEASWLIAEKELQRINAYKSPCEKLCCIFNCCKVINNLLINASMSSDHVPAGADDFLPVIIYVTIKASSHWRILPIYTQTLSSSSSSGGRQSLFLKQLITLLI